MRHGKRFNHLSRTSAHRKAMLANMASSLILHKRIQTTLAKAKALRTYVEPLITKSKTDSTHSRRVVFSYLNSKEAVTELFREVSAKVASRPGGYTRIIKIGPRLGDNAEMAMIELVDYNENLLGTKESKGVKKSRRRRGSAKKQAEEAIPAAPGMIKDSDSVQAEEIEADAVSEEPAQAEESLEEKEEGVKAEENAGETADEETRPEDVTEEKTEPVAEETEKTAETEADEAKEDEAATPEAEKSDDKKVESSGEEGDEEEKKE
jgi:large subunit ribosomal protein L17